MDYLLGVINKDTNKYENILFVKKPNKYKCIGCDKDLILRKGQKNFQSFIHKNNKRCEYFKYPQPYELNRDAILYLKTLLEDNNVNIYRKCSICKFNIKMDIPVYNESKFIQVNYKLDDNNNGMNLIYIDKSNNQTICCFEVYSGQPTKNSNYPFYQINQNDLILQCRRNFATQKIEVVCKKTIICDKCTKYV